MLQLKNIYKNFLNAYLFASSMLGLAPKPYSFLGEPLQCIPLPDDGGFHFPMPGVKCPKCAQKGNTVWVLQGKNCPKCGHPCKERAPEKPSFLTNIAHVFIQTTASLGLKFALPCATGLLIIVSLLYYVPSSATDVDAELVASTALYSNSDAELVTLYSNSNAELVASTALNSNSDTPFGSASSSPLDQFTIREIVTLTLLILNNIRITLTNMSVYLLIAGWLSIAFNLIAINNKKIIINKWSLSLETVYSTVQSIVINQINSSKGQIYLPFIYSLFTFILVNNLIGMVPYSFAPTSHFILTFSLSFTIVLGSTFLGFNIHGLKFFSLFVPSGCPLGLLPLLVLIEFISYLSRNVSLGLRLGANILSGHMLLNILSGFTYNIMSTRILFFFLGLIPLSFIIAFSGLELGIAFIQAQVFVVLTCSYIKDSLVLH